MSDALKRLSVSEVLQPSLGEGLRCEVHQAKMNDPQLSDSRRRLLYAFDSEGERQRSHADSLPYAQD